MPLDDDNPQWDHAVTSTGQDIDGNFVTIDEFGDLAVDSPERDARSGSAPRSGRSGLVLLGLLALAGAWITFSLTRSAGDDSTSSSEDLPTAAAIPSEPDQPEESTSSTSTEVDNAIVDQQALVDWYREMTRGSSTEGSSTQGSSPHAIVWPVEDGLAVLTTSGYSVVDPPIAINFQEASGLELFSGGGRTWGVDSQDPTSAYVMSMNQKIVSTGIEQAIAYEIDNGETVSVGVSSFGGWSAGTELPAGTETLSISGIGLLVLPETGGTLLVRGSGLLPITDDRIVAGTGDTVIVQRCDDTLTCGLYVASFSAIVSGNAEPGAEVAVDIGTDVVPSPNGEWVLATKPDGAIELVGVGDRGRQALPGGDPTVISWAGDGSFVAWLTLDGELHLAFPEQRYESAELPDRPVSPGLLITTATP